MRGIEGWFSEDEGRWYARFARAVVGGVFVEVGCWKGRSTSFIGKICNANRTRLLCVDHWGGSHDILQPRYEAALATENVEEIFRANMRDLGIEVEVIAKPSIIAARELPPASVDRVFLDGSHDGESVAADLDAWSSRLKPDGILAGHDYAPKYEGLRSAVDDFAARHGLVVRRGPRDIWFYEPAAPTRRG